MMTRKRRRRSRRRRGPPRWLLRRRRRCWSGRVGARVPGRVGGPDSGGGPGVWTLAART